MTDPLLGPQDAATAARLAREPILWLSTVDRTARPHTAPVWFLFAPSGSAPSPSRSS